LGEPNVTWSSKALGLFLARFALTFGALLYTWQWVWKAYSTATAAVGNWLLPHSSLAELSFTVNPGDPRSGDHLPLLLTARSLARGMTVMAVNVPIDLYSLAYTPTACLIGLALATSGWWSRTGLLHIAIALTLMTGFLLGSLAAPLVLFFASPAPLQLLELSVLAERTLDVLYRTLVAPPGMTYAIPGLLWLATLWFMPNRSIGSRLAKHLRPQ
jgi:hypothetical protein